MSLLNTFLSFYQKYQGNFKNVAKYFKLNQKLHFTLSDSTGMLRNPKQRKAHLVCLALALYNALNLALVPWFAIIMSDIKCTGHFFWGALPVCNATLWHERVGSALLQYLACSEIVGTSLVIYTQLSLLFWLKHASEELT
jgi:hypothetical protein